MWKTCLASGKVKEATLRTTQGNLGLKGHALDHSTGGCTIIALLIISASLVNIASSDVIEKIIDVFCQESLQHIRAMYYTNKGFEHVSSEEAFNEVYALKLLGIPDVN